jgi:hypothetical protein
LEGILDEINPDDFCGNEDCFGMFTAHDDARTREKPSRVNCVPNISGRYGIILNE